VALRIEEAFGAQRTHVSDITGATLDTDSLTFGQRYRLSLDRGIYESIHLSLTGTYEEPRAWAHTSSQAVETSSEFLSRRWYGDANLGWGTSILGGGLTYTRRREDTDAWTTASPQPRLHFSSTPLESETYAVYLGWKPADLPSLSLRLSRDNAFDPSRLARDTTSDSASITTDYTPTKQVDLGYSVAYVDATDHLHASESQSVAQSARAAYRETFFSGRTNAYVSYNLGSSVLDVTARGLGGTVSTPRPSVGGLSLVETFPATPTNVTLKSNPALVDGNLADGAGLNLGFSRSLAGDVVPRDMGLQFAEPLQPLNTFYVWVDRQLPPEISSAVVWTAYTSDDNLTWTPLSVASQVFGVFDNRFEITLGRTSAKYVKVVAKPIPFSVTTDPRYSDILVTEVQAFLIVSAASVAGRTSSTASTINGTATTRILDSPFLAHDLSFGLASTSALISSGASWFLSNGLGLSHHLSRAISASARIARADSGAQSAHQGQWTWGGSLAAEPLPTLGAAVVYSGSEQDSNAGVRLSNNVSLTGRADLYTGVSVSANGGYGVANDEKGRTTRSLLSSASAGIIPNPVIAINGSYSLSRNDASGGGLPPSNLLSQQILGGLVFTPFPALSVVGSVTRLLVTDQTPQTVLAAQLGFSPFQGGALVLSAGHSESYQSDTQLKSRQTFASVTWKIRPGTLLDSSYSLSDTRSPVQKATAQAVLARLTISL
jgi:hypothetical protein